MIPNEDEVIQQQWIQHRELVNLPSLYTLPNLCMEQLVCQ